jgi:hypothetical protein
MTPCQKLTAYLIAALCTGTASAQIAYVYIPNGTSTYAYDVSSTGKLKAIAGSPFPTTGDLVGSNGSFFLTVDSESVYSYAIAPNGAIGEQVSDINTQNYTGSACGTPSAGGRANPTAGLDNTGENVYVPLYEASEATCNAIQTFKVSKTGTLTFKGATIYAEGANIAGAENVPTLTGNNKFAFNYLSVPRNCAASGLKAFSRESSGTLNNINFTETNPVPEPNKYTGYLATAFVAADPTKHLAIVVEPTNGCGTGTGQAQLASYTVDQGNIASTNTYENMPTLPTEAGGGSGDMQIDPTGKFLAIAIGTGVQVFHFNGAKPITPFTGIIGTSGYVTQVAWDNDGHLYALNAGEGEMHVYNVTSAKVKETAGSPSAVSVGFGLFAVRSK